MVNPQKTKTRSNSPERREKNIRKVVFVCFDNAFLSQVAEAVVNHQPNMNWKAYSAGIRPVKHVHPLTAGILREVDILYQGRTKYVDEFFGQDFDLVVTLDNVAAEKCPSWLGLGKRMHLNFSDPSRNIDDEIQLRQAYQLFRDEISKKLTDLLIIYN
jgi:arsenate reductase (thioredoxin)